MPGTKLYTQNKLEGNVLGLEKGKLGFPDPQEAAYFAPLAGWRSTPPLHFPPKEQTVLTVLRDSERFYLGGQWTALLPDH